MPLTLGVPSVITLGFALLVARKTSRISSGFQGGRASILHAKRPMLLQQPNVYLEPKCLRYLYLYRFSLSYLSLFVSSCFLIGRYCFAD